MRFAALAVIFSLLSASVPADAAAQIRSIKAAIPRSAPTVGGAGLSSSFSNPLPLQLNSLPSLSLPAAAAAGRDSDGNEFNCNGNGLEKLEERPAPPTVGAERGIAAFIERICAAASAGTEAESSENMTAKAAKRIEARLSSI